MRRNGVQIILLLVALLGLRPQGTCASSALELNLRPVIGDEILRLDSLRYTNRAGETFSVSRLSLLLSGVALETPEGKWIEAPDKVAWLDLQRQRTSLLLTNLPAGTYRSVRFAVGLEEATNLGDPARYPADHPLNPNLNGLHWSWQGGYIFLACEGHYRVGTTEPQGFSYHLARSPNRTTVNLVVPLDLRQDTQVAIDFDLGALLNLPRPISFARDGASTHSRENDPLAAALVANLPGSFRVRQVLSRAPDIARPSPVTPLYLPETYTAYPFTVSATFPIPALPRDNPLLLERINLGRQLFEEKLLSRDQTVACASCHLQPNAFADPRRFSVGIQSQTGTRNAMPLFNLAWKSSFFWDGRAPSLRAQALMPIQDPTEMGESLDHVVTKLAQSTVYPPLFAAAFGSTNITPEKIGLAIENFLLTQTSFNSKFDQAMRGQTGFSPAEQRGFELFMMEYEPRSGRFGADCFHCHGGALFTDHQFHNNGLAPEPADPGRAKVSGQSADRGKFVTPSLRNVALTAPYMHDGRFSTLAEVIAHYDHGLTRSETLDPNLAKHPAAGLGLSQDDQAALVAFLETLTDPKFAGGGQRP